MRTFTLALLLVTLGLGAAAYHLAQQPSYRVASAPTHCTAEPCYPPQVRGLLP